MRPSLSEFIRRTAPQWDGKGFICFDDLGKFRRDYVKEVLQDEIGELSALDNEVIESLQQHEILSSDISNQFEKKLTFGERLSDSIAAFGGSWTFIIFFSVILLVWVVVNSFILANRAFDPYPVHPDEFGPLRPRRTCRRPVIMMSQNRSEARDRLRGENDYKINLKAELEIRHLHEKLDHLLRRQYNRLFEIQQIQIELARRTGPKAARCDQRASSDQSISLRWGARLAFHRIPRLGSGWPTISVEERAATRERYAPCPANTRSNPRPATSAINIDYAAELNEQQLAAVTASPGPLLVIAGAGSGKTRTLTYRVAYLLENGIDPRNILLLTFTNKAARQMLERVANLLPVDASGLWGGTFHSIGNRMLRRHGSALGYSSGFTIMDREDQKDLIDTVVAAAGINPKEIRFPKGDVLAEIFSFVVNTETPIDALLAEKFPYFLPLLEQITRRPRALREEKEEARTRWTSTTSSRKTLRMLKEHEHIADFYRRQFQFILVDEYQDTNKIQADFIDTLAAEHRNVMVVGDDAQSIYSWRGANFKNILAFPERYPDAQVFKIELNYRSVPEILQVANAAIAANVKQFRKELARDAAEQRDCGRRLSD